MRDTEDFTPTHVFAGQHGQLRYANVSVMDDAADLHRAYTVMHIVQWCLKIRSVGASMSLRVLLIPDEHRERWK